MDGLAGTAGKVSDASVTGNNLVEMGSPIAATSFIPPQINGAYSSNNFVNNYLKSSSNFALNTSGFTIEGWVNWEGHTPNAGPLFLIPYIDGQWLLPDPRAYGNYLRFDNDTTVEFGLDDSSATSHGVAWTISSITDTNWHYVAVTWDGTNAVLYIDGVSQGAQNMAFPLLNLSNPLYMFDYPPADVPAPSFINGSMDEWRISNIARSAAEISGYYQQSGI